MHSAALSTDVLGGMLENGPAVGNPVAAHVLRGLRGLGWSWGIYADASRVWGPARCQLKMPHLLWP